MLFVRKWGRIGRLIDISTSFKYYLPNSRWLVWSFWMLKADLQKLFFSLWKKESWCFFKFFGNCVSWQLAFLDVLKGHIISININICGGFLKLGCFKTRMPYLAFSFRLIFKYVSVPENYLHSKTWSICVVSMWLMFIWVIWCSRRGIYLII